MTQMELELPQALLDEYWNIIYKDFHTPEENPKTIVHEKILEEILSTLNEYIANIADESISTVNGEYDEDKYDRFINELFKNFIKNYSSQKSFEDNAYDEYVILKRKYTVSETPQPIKKEDLIPGTKALYGIEFESIIVDISNEDYICISDNKLYDTIIDKSVTDYIYKFMKNLFDFDIPNLFEYQVSGLNCNKPPRSDKRLEFASHALSPTNHKPSELFDTLERIINVFNQWTDEKYYLPDHGTIAFLSDDKNQVYTTLTGGTHMTISFPLTKTDNPVTWKYFMWLFTGLVTMYQPIYVALNGAPSPKTKGSERQRTSGSIVIGSAYIYNIFTPESERYEIFINTPDGRHLPDYPEYAHWNDKDLSYKKGGPWRSIHKADIGNSSYDRSDSFNLFNRNDFITDDKEKVLNKQFYEKYKILIRNIACMTSNLIEFRFFDNEPIQHLHNKFNLLIRMADYAYEQTKNMEVAIGIEELGTFIKNQIDDKLNIRPLVNKKPWHDAVLESMNEGLDATFKEDFIDECYKFLRLTPFSTLLELKEISAIDLNKIFVDEMNTAEHHFSEYFQTNNPTSDYSKEHQIKKLRESQKIAKNKKKAYDEEKARKDEAERLQYEKIKAEHIIIVKEIIIENIAKLKESETNKELTNLINKYINIDKLANITVLRIYGGRLTSGLIVEGQSVEEIKEESHYLINVSILISYTEKIFEQLNNWFKDSLLLDLRLKDPTLKAREDAREEIENRNREREREREQQLQREREKIEEQTNFIANIITKNITNITDETLKDLILNTIHLRKISDTLRKSIYVNKASIQYITDTVGTFFVSTLDDVSMINLNDESKIMLYKWFIESLLPDLESNVPELRERSQLQTTTDRIIPQTEADKKGEIYQIIVKTVNRLNNVSQHAVVTTILYTKLVDILYHRIYVVQQSFNEIEEISELIINDAKPENTTRTFEQDDIVKAWFKVGLLSELRDTLLTRLQVIETRNHSGVIEHRHTSNNYWHPETRIHAAQTDIPSGHILPETTQPTQYPRNYEDQVVVIEREIRNNVESMAQTPSDELGHLIRIRIGFEKCAKVLQRLIYEENYTTSDIRDHADEIIQESRFSSITNEEHPKIKFWVQGILIDLLKKVTPIRETRGREPLDVLTEQSPPPAHGESEMITLYAVGLENIMDHYAEINELPEGFKLYSDIDIAKEQYYNENPRSSNVNLYKINIAINDLSSHGNNLFVTIRPTLRVEIEKIPTTYATELEAVESEERIENETSIILDIIKLNISNLENPEMRNIVLKYILLNTLAKKLYELIYILKYNTLELREHFLVLLIQEGFYDELEEDYVKDPEVISLLKIWIEDYLIPDLVKGTSLQLGGLDVLFG